MIPTTSTVEKEFLRMVKRDLSSKGAMERRLLAEQQRILGVDEVGRGCIAGPVYAACVNLDYRALKKLSPADRALIRDSKTLSSAQRQKIRPTLLSICHEWAIGAASVAEIEQHGIVAATFQAMFRAFQELRETYDVLLIDGKQTNAMLPIKQFAIIGGDGLCFAIAAASILAKEARDDFMRNVARQYPDFDFAENVGYGTKSHLTALDARGITPLHRRNFAPVQRYVELGHYWNPTP